MPPENRRNADVDLLREILLYLETRQVSPRATVIVDTRQEALDLSCSQDEFTKSLCFLLDIGYIEGPGAHGDGLWLFRKLTQKGNRFVHAASDLTDWAILKRQRLS